MSNIEITELGRKWYGVCVYFSEDDIDRISPDILRGLGGKLRYDTAGGLRALFHFNVTKKESSESMLKVLKYFGAEGYFQTGVNLTHTASESITESPSAMTSVITAMRSNCKTWSDQWKGIVESAVAKKATRIELLRHIKELNLAHVSESIIRMYTEELLRRKYKSDIFVETFMWRLGWPDNRKPFAINENAKQITSAS